MRHLYRLLLGLMAFLLCLPTLAQHRSASEARRVAFDFLRQHSPTPKGKVLRTQARRATDLHLRPTAGSTPTAYIVHDASTRFVVVSAPTAMPTILGYGEGLALSDSLPPALASLLHSYDEQWQRLQDIALPQATPSSSITPIAPFLGIVRHQSAPFNGGCPYYIGAKGDTSATRTLVGCVATSMEQVLSYYARPITLRDSLPARTTPHYHVPALPAGTVLPFDRTLHDYRNGYTPDDSVAVAQVSAALGLVSRMRWGLHESGTTFTAPIDHLRHALGLGYVHYLDSYRYTPQVWWQMLYNELRHGRPVMYAGSMMTLGAHAFVIDGVDAEGRVHVHWGFGGQCNGFFRLSVLNPFSEAEATPADDLHGLFFNHQAIFLHPDPQPALPDTLVRHGREVVVDSLHLHRSPTNQGYAPATLYVRNTSPVALTTPFAVFTNQPTDTATFRQGRAVGATGCSLEAYESRALPIHLRFTQAGTLHLRITPDDATILYDSTIHIAPAPPVALGYSLRLLHTTDSTLTAVATYDNTSGTHHSGARITYCLFEGDDRTPDTDRRHYAYIDVAPGQVLTDTLHFGHLSPATTYYLALRHPWAIQADLHIATAPATDALTSIHSATPTPAPTAPRYDLHGRPLRPNTPYRWRKGAIAF